MKIIGKEKIKYFMALKKIRCRNDNMQHVYIRNAGVHHPSARAQMRTRARMQVESVFSFCCGLLSTTSRGKAGEINNVGGFVLCE